MGTGTAGRDRRSGDRRRAAARDGDIRIHYKGNPPGVQPVKRSNMGRFCYIMNNRLQVATTGIAIGSLRDDVVAVKLVVGIALSCAHTACVVLHLDVVPLGENSDSTPFEVMTAVAPRVAHHIVGDAYSVVVDKLILPAGACVLVKLYVGGGDYCTGGYSICTLAENIACSVVLVGIGFSKNIDS